MRTESPRRLVTKKSLACLVSITDRKAEGSFSRPLSSNFPRALPRSIAASRHGLRRELAVTRLKPRSPDLASSFSAARGRLAEDERRVSPLHSTADDHADDRKRNGVCQRVFRRISTAAKSNARRNTGARSGLLRRHGRRLLFLILRDESLDAVGPDAEGIDAVGAVLDAFDLRRIRQDLEEVDTEQRSIGPEQAIPRGVRRVAPH